MDGVSPSSHPLRRAVANITKKLQSRNSFSGTVRALVASNRARNLHDEVAHDTEELRVLQNQLHATPTAQSAPLEAKIASLTERIQTTTSQIDSCGTNLTGTAKVMFLHSTKTTELRPIDKLQTFVLTRGKESTKFAIRNVAKRAAQMSLRQKLREIDRIHLEKEGERSRLQKELAKLKSDISEAKTVVAGHCPSGGYDCSLQERKAEVYVLEERSRNVRSAIATLDADFADRYPLLTVEEERIHRGMQAAKQDKLRKKEEAVSRQTKLDALHKRQRRLAKKRRPPDPSTRSTTRPLPSDSLHLKLQFFEQISLHKERLDETLREWTQKFSQIFETLSHLAELLSADDAEQEDLRHLALQVWEHLAGIRRAAKKGTKRFISDVHLTQLTPAEREIHRQRFSPAGHVRADGFNTQNFSDNISIRAQTCKLLGTATKTPNSPPRHSANILSPTEVLTMQRILSHNTDTNTDNETDEHPEDFFYAPYPSIIDVDRALFEACRFIGLLECHYTGLIGVVLSAVVVLSEGVGVLDRAEVRGKGTVVTSAILCIAGAVCFQMSLSAGKMRSTLCIFAGSRKKSATRWGCLQGAHLGRRVASSHQILQPDTPQAVRKDRQIPREMLIWHPSSPLPHDPPKKTKRKTNKFLVYKARHPTPLKEWRPVLCSGGREKVSTKEHVDMIPLEFDLSRPYVSRSVGLRLMLREGATHRGVLSLAWCVDDSIVVPRITTLTISEGSVLVCVPSVQGGKGKGKGKGKGRETVLPRPLVGGEVAQVRSMAAAAGVAVRSVAATPS